MFSTQTLLEKVESEFSNPQQSYSGINPDDIAAAHLYYFIDRGYKVDPNLATLEPLEAIEYILINKLESASHYQTLEVLAKENEGLKSYLDIPLLVPNFFSKVKSFSALNISKAEFQELKELMHVNVPDNVNADQRQFGKTSRELFDAIQKKLNKGQLLKTNKHNLEKILALIDLLHECRDIVLKHANTLSTSPLDADTLNEVWLAIFQNESPDHLALLGSNFNLLKEIAEELFPIEDGVFYALTLLSTLSTFAMTNPISDKDEDKKEIEALQLANRFSVTKNMDRRSGHGHELHEQNVINQLKKACNEYQKILEDEMIKLLDNNDLYIDYAGRTTYEARIAGNNETMVAKQSTNPIHDMFVDYYWSEEITRQQINEQISALQQNYGKKPEVAEQLANEIKSKYKELDQTIQKKSKDQQNLYAFCRENPAFREKLEKQYRAIYILQNTLNDPSQTHSAKIQAFQKNFNENKPAFKDSFTRMIKEILASLSRGLLYGSLWKTKSSEKHLQDTVRNTLAQDKPKPR